MKNKNKYQNENRLFFYTSWPFELGKIGWYILSKS